MKDAIALCLLLISSVLYSAEGEAAPKGTLPKPAEPDLKLLPEAYQKPSEESEKRLLENAWLWQSSRSILGGGQDTLLVFTKESEEKAIRIEELNKRIPNKTRGKDLVNPSQTLKTTTCRVLGPVLVRGDGEFHSFVMSDRELALNVYALLEKNIWYYAQATMESDGKLVIYERRYEFKDDPNTKDSGKVHAWCRWGEQTLDVEADFTIEHQEEYRKVSLDSGVQKGVRHNLPGFYLSPKSNVGVSTDELDRFRQYRPTDVVRKDGEITGYTHKRLDPWANP